MINLRAHMKNDLIGTLGEQLRCLLLIWKGTFAFVGSGSCCIFCPLLYMQFLGMRLVHRCLFTHFTKGDYDRCYDEGYITHTPRKEE